MNTEAKNQLKESLNALEDIKGDTVPAEDVRAFVSLVKEFFTGEAPKNKSNKPEVFGKLSELAKVINSARRELDDVNPSYLHQEELPQASNELDEIVKTTEKATNKIVDSTEQLQGVNSRIRERLMMVDPPIDEDVMMSVDDAFAESETHISAIYEACNFQDLTGQRIKKIRNVLADIERQVMHLVIVFGLENRSGNLTDKEKEKLLNEADLLKGPNKEGEGLEQDDIDDILSKLI